MRRSETQIQTVVLQPTPFCNIQCKYCYLPQRDDTSVMDLQTVIASFQRVFDSPFAGSHITVLWHAGGDREITEAQPAEADPARRHLERLLQ